MMGVKCLPEVIQDGHVFSSMSNIDKAITFLLS